MAALGELGWDGGRVGGCVYIESDEWGGGGSEVKGRKDSRLLLLSINNRSPFFCYDSCDSTCLPFVLQISRPVPDHCHSSSRSLGDSMALRRRRRNTNMPTPPPWSAASPPPRCTDLATGVCHARLSHRSHIAKRVCVRPPPRRPSLTPPWRALLSESQGLHVWVTEQGTSLCSRLSRVDRTSSNPFFWTSYSPERSRGGGGTSGFLFFL